MSLRVLSLCLAICLLAVATLAGCTEHQARFADATPAQLERTYLASSGGDLVLGMFLGFGFSGLNNTTSCPTVTTEGLNTTVTGGCTKEDGTRVEGSIAIHNPPDSEVNPAYDPSQSSTIKFDFRVTTPEHKSIAFDGDVALDKSGVSDDLTIDVAGIASTSRLGLACTSNGLCSASPDSEIEISDLGGASVEGSWSFGEPPSGRVTVRGVDDVVFDLARIDDNGCVPYMIDDQPGTVCPGSALEDILPAFAGNGSLRGSLPLLKAMK